MTLKQKFENVEICIESQLLNLKYDEYMNCVDDCEQIADEFAIGFAEWISLKGYKSYSNGWANFNTKAVNEKELLEIYKKEKRL
jgi:hypothetical protein